MLAAGFLVKIEKVYYTEIDMNIRRRASRMNFSHESKSKKTYEGEKFIVSPQSN